MKYNKTKASTDENKQTLKAEKKLGELLDKICQALDIRLAEWDLDKALFVAIVSSSEERLARSAEACQAYDKYYQCLKDLGINVGTQYRWFTDIQKHI
jgi:hypothetical protein